MIKYDNLLIAKDNFEDPEDRKVSIADNVNV